MDINLTLVGQGITFFLFILFTMKFVWPPLSAAMEERQAKIAEGLNRAERGQQELAQAQEKAAEIVREARTQASEIIEQANKRGGEIVEEAKQAARVEGERLIAQAHSQIEQERTQVRAELQQQVAALAVTGAAKILEREVDASAHNAMLEELASQL